MTVTRGTQFGQEDRLALDFGDCTTRPEQRHQARLVVADRVRAGGGTPVDLIDTLAMLGLIDPEARPT